MGASAAAAPMIWNPDLIHYLCIAKSTTILAHHYNKNNNASKNSSFSNIETLASQCLANTPPNHSLFTHTANNHHYIFLIDSPFVFFAIFDHNLIKPLALSFLNRIKSSLRETLATNDQFAPFSLQTLFDSVFNEALSFDSVSPKRSPGSTLRLLGKPNEGLKKKKRLDGNAAAMVDVSDEVVSLKANDRQKAKHIWKKHVWVVLLLDLFVCAILFVIWLWVCSGFHCMTY